MFKKSSPLKDPSSFLKGYEYAIFLLSLRNYSQKQLETKMHERGYIEDVITKTISELKKLKYINDENMALSMLESFKNYHTYGYYAIKQKMLLKKLPNKQIEQALENLSIADEIKIAKRYLEKQSRISNKTTDPKLQKQKLMQKLKARGFRMDVIKKV